MAEMTEDVEKGKWARRRRRDDDSRPRKSAPHRLAQKALNLLRRLTIVLIRPYLRRFSHRPLPKLDEVRSVLIIPHDPIGDLLLTEPLWRKLREAKKDLRIGLVVSPRNRQLAETIAPELPKYDLYGGSLLHRFNEMLRARKNAYDVVLAPVGFYKPTRFAVISRVIAGAYGFTATMHHSRARRYADLYSYCTERHWQPFPQPMAEQYQALIESVFALRFEDAERAPRLVLPEEAMSAAREHMAALRSTGSMTIVLHLEAKVPTREWGIPNALKLAQEVPNATFLFSGSPEFWQAHRLPDSMSSNVRKLDTGSILELAAVVANVDMLVSPDTSIVHFAAALGTRIIAFYPSRDEWLPYRSDATILTPVRREPISTIRVADVRNAILRSFA